MALIAEIAAALTDSLKKRDEARTATLRMLKTALKNRAIADRMPETEIPDETVIAIIRQEAKKRKESITAYRAGNREDLAKHEEAELALLETYLPAQMSAEELRSSIASVIAEQNIPKPYKPGPLTGQVMKKIAGRADGNAVSAAVQAYLAEQVAE